MSKSDPKHEADVWNAHNPDGVGADVIYTNDCGADLHTRTRSIAQVLGGHTAVIWIEGIAGCVRLDRVRLAEAAQEEPAEEWRTITVKASIDLEELDRVYEELTRGEDWQHQTVRLDAPHSYDFHTLNKSEDHYLEAHDLALWLSTLKRLLLEKRGQPGEGEAL